MTPNPDGTVSIVADIEAPPAEGMIVSRCDQPFDANGNCPSGLMVVRVPLTGTPSFIATPPAGLAPQTSGALQTAGILVGLAGLGAGAYYLFKRRNSGDVA